MSGDRVDRHLLVALAACCAAPMVGIIVLTTVAGIALGTSSAIALGVVAAGVCVAIMWQHHRSGGNASQEEHPDRVV